MRQLSGIDAVADHESLDAGVRRQIPKKRVVNNLDLHLPQLNTVVL
jgi:hypothetical protein